MFYTFTLFSIPLSFPFPSLLRDCHNHSLSLSPLLSVCLSLPVSLPLCICLSVCLSVSCCLCFVCVCVCVCLSAWLLLCLSVSLPCCMSVCLPLCVCLCLLLSLCLATFVSLGVCLYLHIIPAVCLSAFYIHMYIQYLLYIYICLSPCLHTVPAVWPLPDCLLSLSLSPCTR